MEQGARKIDAEPDNVCSERRKCWFFCCEKEEKESKHAPSALRYESINREQRGSEKKRGEPEERQEDEEEKGNEEVEMNDDDEEKEQEEEEEEKEEEEEEQEEEEEADSLRRDECVATRSVQELTSCREAVLSSEFNFAISLAEQFASDKELLLVEAEQCERSC